MIMLDANLQNLNLENMLNEIVAKDENRYFNVSFSDLFTQDAKLLLPIKLDQQCFDFMFK